MTTDDQFVNSQKSGHKINSKNYAVCKEPDLLSTYFFRYFHAALSMLKNCKVLIFMLSFQNCRRILGFLLFFVVIGFFFWIRLLSSIDIFVFYQHLILKKNFFLLAKKWIKWSLLLHRNIGCYCFDWIFKAYCKLFKIALEAPRFSVTEALITPNTSEKNRCTGYWCNQTWTKL